MKRPNAARKRHQQSRARAEATRRRDQVRRRAAFQTFYRTTRAYFEKQARAETVEVVAPEHFSLVDAPDETVRFFNQIERQCAARNHVRVDLRGVTTMTPDAVAVLVSRVNDRRYTHRMSVSGRSPHDAEAMKLLMECGFFEHVRVSGPRPPTDGVSAIHKRKSVKVEASMSAKLLKRIDAIVPGSDFAWDGVQRVIVESMTNTENHAKGKKSRREGWWLSVHCDPTAGIARFCFFDNGVGIYRSLRQKNLLDSMMTFFGINDHPALLQKILDGKVPSSTGLGHRGKGLPKIAAAHARKQFRRLIILANDVYADVENGVFRTIPVSFSGTLLYWEHHAD